MEKDQIEREYGQSKQYFKELQEEVFNFLSDIIELHKDLHVADIAQRPNNEIKTIKSIKSNIEKTSKYNTYKTLFDIKDLAGLRITCHCQDDVDRLSKILNGELRQRYSNVTLKTKEADDFDPYWGLHFYFSKPIRIEKKDVNLFCEIQIRTVLGNAWAIQSHKYLYKNHAPGEPQELSIAASEIMNGCEKLWSLVKSMSMRLEVTGIKKGVSVGNEIKEISESKEQAFNKNLNPLYSWINLNRSVALEGLNKLKIPTYMEVIVVPITNMREFTISMLMDSAQKSTIKTFGWPIGLFNMDREEFAIKMDADGIHTEISIDEPDFVDPKINHKSYDYWSIHRSATFYLLKSLFEDQRKPGRIFFDTRIVRITEVLMYLEKLFSNMGLPKADIFEITIKHSGLRGRVLSSASEMRRFPGVYEATGNEDQKTIQTSFENVHEKLSDIVEKVTLSLFDKFESFKLENSILENIVADFYRGRIV